MSHDTPLRDDILFLLSQLYGSGVPFPVRGIAKIIYKHTGRYSNLESARTKVHRELSRLNDQGYVERSMIDWIGVEINGWVLTKRGVQFVLAGRKDRASSVASPERDLSAPYSGSPNQTPISKETVEVRDNSFRIWSTLKEFICCSFMESFGFLSIPPFQW